MIVNVGPGPPRAARHGRARRGGQGRADPRPARRARTASCRPTSRCSTRHLRDDLDTSPSARAATCAAVVRGRTGGDRGARRADRARAALRRALQPAQHARRGGGGAGARGRARRARSRSRSRRLRGEVVELAGGVTVVNDCYNANPMSMRAALEHLAAQPGRAADRGARRHGRAGRRRRALPPRDRRARARRARDRRARHRRRRGARRTPRASAARRTRSATPEEAGALLEEIAAPRRPRAREGLALRRPRAGRSALSVMGEILIGGMALAAHLHLPRAEVHRLPARARVRPAHPRGGAGGPPREGRHADDGRAHDLRSRSSVPFLILSDYRAVSLGGARHGARQRRARLRRRLDEDHASAARSASRARTSCSPRPRSRSGCGWSRPSTSGSPDMLRLRIVDASIDLGPALPGAHLPRAGGGDQRREPHRRPRRPGRRLRGDRAARLHRR